MGHSMPVHLVSSVVPLGFSGNSVVKNLLAKQETQVQLPGRKIP